ncbi:hypothetical protein AT984_19765 [Paucibacter sp. KCTC 42545]|nr:hypothetical protein AT984_19765 [Paucibacter sp. KCTC 42545]
MGECEFVILPLDLSHGQQFMSKVMECQQSCFGFFAIRTRLIPKWGGPESQTRREPATQSLRCWRVPF